MDVVAVAKRPIEDSSVDVGDTDGVSDSNGDLFEAGMGASGRAYGPSPLLPKATPVCAAIAPETVFLPDVAQLVLGDGTKRSCTEDALQLLLYAAKEIGGARVFFDCGQEPVTIALSKPLTIESDTPVAIDGGGLVVLDGGRHTRLVEVGVGARVGFFNLGFWRGNAKVGLEGGAVYYPDGAQLGVLLIDHCFFDDNLCEQGVGGAVVVRNAVKVAIRQSLFNYNRSGTGGAVAVYNSSLEVVDSWFTDNQVYQKGGGVNLEGHDNYEGDAVICGAVFSQNAAAFAGAAVRAYLGDGQKVTVVDTLFSENRVEPPQADSRIEARGTYLQQGGELVMTDATFSGNSAPVGAGLTVGGGTAEVINGTFVGNQAVLDGGGGWIAQSAVTFTSCTFFNNRALQGAAIYADSDASVQVSGSLSVDNFNWDGIPASCNRPLAGIQNLFWASANNAGDDIGCVPDGAVARDPGLLLFGNHGGAVPTVSIEEQSAARGLVADCPPTDARNVVRISPCAAGAFEWAP